MSTQSQMAVWFILVKPNTKIIGCFCHSKLKTVNHKTTGCLFCTCYTQMQTMNIFAWWFCTLFRSVVVNALNATGLIQIHVSWCVQTVCGGARDSSRPTPPPPPPHVCWLIRQPQLKYCWGPGYPEHCNYIIFSWSVESEGGRICSSVIWLSI